MLQPQKNPYLFTLDDIKQSAGTSNVGVLFVSHAKMLIHFLNSDFQK